MRTAAWAAAIAVVVCGCAPVPRPREPIGAEQGALFARLAFKGRGFPNVLTHCADEAFFARVTPRGDLDLDHPIPSDYSEDGLVYAFNVPPGRYTPIVAAYTSLGLRYVARIEAEARRAMTVDVGPGQIIFAGSRVLRTEWQGLGAMLGNFARHVVGVLPLTRRPSVGAEGTATGNDRTPEEEAAALRRARIDLVATTWIDAVDRRLAELGAPPPPLSEGLFRKRALPRLKTARFSYVDSIHWGSPSQLPGGLLWRDPKGRALISVAFLAQDTIGYKPVDSYLRDMREAGEADDAHALFDVAVSSQAGKGARYTTFVYPPDALPGGRAEVFVTESLLVPRADGYYVLRLRARRGDFDAIHPTFRRFVDYVRFEPRGPKT